MLHSGGHSNLPNLMAEQFQISKGGESEFVDKGSKFLAICLGVNSEEEAKEIMNTHRQKHPKANHHCYAYRILLDGKVVENLSDDGEPTHSAGQPILKQLQSADLVNSLAIVIRYFGGVKLGVGGLIKAYRQSTADAIQEAKRELIVPKTTIKYEVPYDLWGDVLAIIDKESLQFQADHQSSGAIVSIEVKLSEADQCRALFDALQLREL